MKRPVAAHRDKSDNSLSIPPDQLQNARFEMRLDRAFLFLPASHYSEKQTWVQTQTPEPKRPIPGLREAPPGQARGENRSSEKGQNGSQANTLHS